MIIEAIKKGLGVWRIRFNQLNDMHSIKRQFIPTSKWLLNSQKLSFVIIGFGLIVRLIQYLSNRSLWADEAVLALNIVNRSYSELLQPLDYDQAAPLGFLIIEKLNVQLFGNNEYALRLLPFLSGILSLFLFYKLANYCLKQQGISIAMALFVSLPYLVYYSSEVKQYSSDVTIALLGGLAMIELTTKTINKNKALFSCILFALAIWSSHPAIFVWAGFATISCFKISQDSIKRGELFSLFSINVSWICSFAWVYFFSLQKLNNNSTLMESWKSAFPSNLFDINWLFEKMIKFFHNPLGFAESLVVFAVIAFLAGFWSLLVSRKKILLIVMMPWIFTVAAAYLNKYPFRNRLLLFLTPFFILVIAEGLNYLLAKRQTLQKWLYAVGMVLLLLMLSPPLTQAASLVIHPYVREEIKPVINYVNSHQQQDDIIYVFQRGEYQFKYYAPKYGYQVGDYIIGVDDLDDGKEVSRQEWRRYKTDLDQLKGNKRVWLIFSHTDDFPEEEAMVLSYLDQLGKSIDFFASPGAFVHLYDFS